MRRITWSALLLLPLAGFGPGCSNQAPPKSDNPVPLPTSGPKPLDRHAPVPALPPAGRP
jgi:hypothetical protein